MMGGSLAMPPVMVQALPTPWTDRATNISQ